MTEREPGFYWVKFEGEWFTASHDNGYYRFAGDGFDRNRYEFDEIGPRIEKPEELK